MYHRSLCRVHWLLFDLSTDFKGYYKLLFDYAKHSYLFYRTYCEGRSNRLKEVFIVIRTSKRCYRLMYYNHYFNVFFQRSYRSACACALEMEYIFTRKHELFL